MLSGEVRPAADVRRAAHFQLSNGMEAVVISDHRAPVVTHMVWYRAGAADGPGHRSGLAHFLEHLMFKSTEKIPDGAFAKIVMQHGGQLNAFTSQDFTAYFEHVATEHLGTMMEMEADRMVGLRLSEEEVTTERQVIIEERASRYDNAPAARLQEQMSAALHIAHPYRLPVIGWAHDIAKLSREDALSFYRRYYAPNNAILVVAGDTTADEVRRLAEATYGRICPGTHVATGTQSFEQRASPAEPRSRPEEPPHEVARRVTLQDKRVGNATFQRIYLAPSYSTAKPGEAEALQVLMAILGDAGTGRLFRRLVLEEKIATGANGGYSGTGLDSGVISLQAVALSHAGLDVIEACVDAVLAEVCDAGVTELELSRAKRSMRASFTFDSDQPGKRAHRYGMALATGLSIDDIEAWPSAIAAVTIDDVKAAANAHLDLRRSVTGLLIPVGRI